MFTFLYYKFIIVISVKAVDGYSFNPDCIRASAISERELTPLPMWVDSNPQPFESEFDSLSPHGPRVHNFHFTFGVRFKNKRINDFITFPRR